MYVYTIASLRRFVPGVIRLEWNGIVLTQPISRLAWHPISTLDTYQTRPLLLSALQNDRRRRPLTSYYPSDRRNHWRARHPLPPSSHRWCRARCMRCCLPRTPSHATTDPQRVQIHARAADRVAPCGQKTANRRAMLRGIQKKVIRVKMTCECVVLESATSVLPAE